MSIASIALMLCCAASSSSPVAVYATADSIPALETPAPPGDSLHEPPPVPGTIAVVRRARRPLVPLKDLGHALRTFGADTWVVVSSPSRMHARDAAWLAGAVAVAGALYAYDEPIYRGFRNRRGTPLYDLALKPGRAIEPVGNMGNTLAYYFGAMGIGYSLQVQPLREVASEFIESHFISGGIRNLAEYAVGRSRPYEGLGPRHFDPGQGTSFPSGHASVVIELATILSHHARSVPASIVIYGLAASALLERVDSRSHWPSDVFIGAATGFVVSRTVVSLHERRHAAVEPLIERRAGTMRIGIARRF